MVLSLLMGTVTFPVHAETKGSEWYLSVPVFLTAATHVQTTADSTNQSETLSAFFEFRLSSPQRPWSAAVIADYRASSASGSANLLKAGAIFRHRFQDWDTVAAVFRRMPRGLRSDVGYAFRVRYRFAARHKIGIESFGRPEQLDSSYLMLGYYGSISDDVTLHLVTGSNINTSNDRAARVEIVWQVN